MHVDRKQFLLLTAAIAAGCGAGQQSSNQLVQQAEDYDTTSTTALQTAGNEPQIASDEPKLGAPPSDDATLVGVPEQPTEPEEPIDPRLSGRCASLRRPSPVCESFDDTVSSCGRYHEVLVSRASEAAVGCLSRRSGTQRICQFGVDVVCALEGAKAAPLDGSAGQQCGSIMSSCSGRRDRGEDLTRANCEAALSGYKHTVRGGLTSCITEFCEIGFCFYQVG